MRCKENRIRIKKLKLVNGELSSPGRDEDFRIRVESCFYRQYFRLNHTNNFCIELDHLSDDPICVYEDGENEVQYRINGVDSSDGCVDFDENSFIEMDIINVGESDSYGTLKIRKEIIQECGETTDASFSFEMRGNQFTRTILLNASNNYMTEVRNIPFGNYVIEEINHEQYDVTYEVNGIVSDVGNIEIDSVYGEMIIYNRRNDIPHVLRISKWIKEGEKLKKPTYPNSYEIQVDDGMAIREYTLHCTNHYSVDVRGYNSQRFVIRENSDNVIYEVDGEIVDVADIRMNEDHEIRIINQKDMDKGSIIIQKWIEEDGRLVVPGPSMYFSVKIHGYSEEVYPLEYANDFTLVLEGVEEGYYRIEESGNDAYDVYYEIDGNREEDGYIHVQSKNVCSVSIINVKKEQSMNTLRFVHSNGNGKEYVLRVESEDRVENVYLDKQNQYDASILVRNGNVRVIAQPVTNDILYRLDGVDHGNNLIFYVKDSNHRIEMTDSKAVINYII